MNIRWIPLMLVLVGIPVFAEGQFAQSQPNTLTLDGAIAQAIASDPWLSGSRYREEALTSESISAATLPDPKVSLMAANFPTDSFDINQEAMTQLTVGVSQMFPRGDSLELTRRQKQELAAQEPLLRQDRQEKVTATVTQLWLDAYRAQESIRLIEQDRSLFEHLVDATKARYSSALGRARQQDIIRAQLELTQLEDRLTVLRQQLESARKRLSEWIGGQASLPLARSLSSNLEDEPSLATSQMNNDRWLFEQINRHPLLLAFDQRIEAMQTGVELVQQKYKPEWGLTAQYGYRDDDPMGRDRADLFSVGVTFDLPLFTGNRQDKDVNAATSRAEALRTDRLLLARKLMAELNTTIVRIQRLNQRRGLYDRQLLPQMAEQAEASLTAYNNDHGDFAEAVRARIAELNAKIDFLTIKIDRLKMVAELNYLLPQSRSGLPKDNLTMSPATNGNRAEGMTR
ncbi:TolC family protein [Aestuariicella hydrocarbonica]|uniref:TolC family protein n=2 Tax=Pseudomaricurvus hydrocarbonicus TaxID=1470433 RepID=A0A9E5JP20_9GAMM|nr:TolC family protein [Aestuariicella hydrocarbonica]